MNALNSGLAASCQQFEQLLLADILRSAGGQGADADEGERIDPYCDMFAQALAGAVERAGGIGIARSLAAAIATERRR